MSGHVLAIAQAICLYRQRGGLNGPLFVGMDTHALSEPAFASALEVFAANDVETMIDGEDGYTPTPVISHAILSYNKERMNGLAGGVVIIPSHNPPDDGGLQFDEWLQVSAFCCFPLFWCCCCAENSLVVAAPLRSTRRAR